MADIETVEADTALGKYKITRASINNLATFASLIGIVLLCWVVWGHAGDSKEGAKAIAAELKESNKAVAQELRESNKEIANILKEMARATRESNCLLALPPEKRPQNAELCRRISQ